MKDRVKIRHGDDIGGRAGGMRQRHRWSWWCNDVTFSVRSGAAKPKLARCGNSPDGIHIPLPARERELSLLPMSARLRHMLECCGCRVLGDLHGLRFPELSERRGCGQRTIQELKTLVGNVKHEALLQSDQPAGSAVMPESSRMVRA
jgi:hypothetical protein